MISRIRRALASAAPEQYLNELRLSRSASRFAFRWHLIGPVNPCPLHADVTASALFCQHILQHRFVEAQIGNQPLQPQIFLFPLPHVFEFRRRNSAIFLTSGVNVAEIPSLRRASGTDVPRSACLRAKTLCSSVKHDYFISTTSVQGSHNHAGTLFLNGPGFWVRVNMACIAGHVCLNEEIN